MAPNIFSSFSYSSSFQSESTLLVLNNEAEDSCLSNVISCLVMSPTTSINHISRIPSDCLLKTSWLLYSTSSSSVCCNIHSKWWELDWRWGSTLTGRNVQENDNFNAQRCKLGEILYGICSTFSRIISMYLPTWDWWWRNLSGIFVTESDPPNTRLIRTSSGSASRDCRNYSTLKSL